MIMAFIFPLKEIKIGRNLVLLSMRK